MALATVATNETSCPDCGGPVVTQGEAYCDDCGVVVDDAPIDHGPEWRSFEDDAGSSPKRATPTAGVTQHDHGRGSEIGYADAPDRQLVQMRKWNKRCRAEGRERTLAFGLSETHRVARAAGLTRSTTEDACVWFRRVHKHIDIEGIGLEGVAAASVLVAARKAEEPITGDDVVDVSRIRGSEQDDFSRRSKERKMWNMIRQIGCEFGVDTTPPNAEVFVARVCAELDVDVRARAVARCRRWQDHNVENGRQPMYVAAAAVWTLTDDLTLREIGDQYGCSPRTLRKIRNDAPEPDKITSY